MILPVVSYTSIFYELEMHTCHKVYCRSKGKYILLNAMKLFPLKRRRISPLLFKNTMKALLDRIIFIAVVVSAWF